MDALLPKTQYCDTVWIILKTEFRDAQDCRKKNYNIISHWETRKQGHRLACDGRHQQWCLFPRVCFSVCKLIMDQWPSGASKHNTLPLWNLLKASESSSNLGDVWARTFVCLHPVHVPCLLPERLSAKVSRAPLNFSAVHRAAHEAETDRQPWHWNQLYYMTTCDPSFLPVLPLTKLLIAGQMTSRETRSTSSQMVRYLG